MANGSITVNKGNTSASITSQTLATTLPGQSFSVSFNAAPSNTANSPTAMTGNVMVSDGVDSCSGAINGSGNGNCSITLNTTGARTLTATYQGDGNFNASAASPGLGHSVTNTATWTGTSSTNWSTAGNWNTQLAPGSSNHADIPAGAVPNEPTIGAFAVNVTNLTVGSGHTLTVNGGGSLTSTGTATINGNFGGSGGTFSFNNLIINNAAGVTLTGNATVSGTLTLTLGNISTGANTLIIPATGTVSRTSGHVIGNLSKSFAAIGSKTFEVGTANGFSPVTADATAGTFPATLTIKATQGAHPNVNAPTSIQRYWTLTGSNLTVNLTFQYLLGDVLGTEANYKVIRISGGTAVSFQTSTVNTGAHTATLNGVSSFSDWTVGQSLPPTAANSTVSGQIVDVNGNPVEGAVVRLSGTQNRKFITDSNGHYSFDNVETNGFYTVTPSRANYLFSPAERSFSQTGNSTEAAFTASVTSGNPLNPLDTPEYFVRQQYLDFLSREPDESGFNFWSDQILSCNSDAACVEGQRINVSAAFFLSIEFQQTGYLVHRMYQAAYGDLPGAPVPIRRSEFKADTAVIGNGVVVLRGGWEELLEGNKEAYATAFVQRARFLSLYTGMGDGQFVDTLNQNAGLVLTQSERDQLVSDLTTSAKTRAQVLRTVAENAALQQQEFNQAFVLMQYFGYLQRDPNAGPDTDFSGYNFWLNKLNTFGGNYQDAEMVRAFLVATEYRGRFPR